MSQTIARNRLLLLRPVPSNFKISSPLGWRSLNNKPEFHPGIDFAVPEATPIKSAIDGKIFRAGYESEADIHKGFGLRVWQEFQYDNETYYAWYGHCKALMVNEGDSIRRGDTIALSGNSGRSTGPHLHFQVRKKDSGVLYDIDWLDA